MRLKQHVHWKSHAKVIRSLMDSNAHVLNKHTLMVIPALTVLKIVKDVKHKNVINALLDISKQVMVNVKNVHRIVINAQALGVQDVQMNMI